MPQHRMHADKEPASSFKIASTAGTESRTLIWKPASSPPMTWSMMPYCLASSGDMYLSRSVSSSICSHVRFVRQQLRGLLSHQAARQYAGHGAALYRAAVARCCGRQEAN